MSGRRVYNDIPGVWMSSGEAALWCFVPVCPGGCLVVAGTGLEAAVEDADEAVGEAAEGVVVLVAVGALQLQAGAGF
jgi:hypothetical protein